MAVRNSPERRAPDVIRPQATEAQGPEERRAAAEENQPLAGKRRKNMVLGAFLAVLALGGAALMMADRDAPAPPRPHVSQAQ